MFDTAIQLIDAAQRIIVIQAENPDGDSIGSSLALEEILGDLGKDVTLFCEIDVPKYLRYIRGWDRITNEWPGQYDLAIIVDTTSETLLQKTLALPGARHSLETNRVLVIDHHTDAADELQFAHDSLITTAVATGEVIYELATQAGWTINQAAAEHLFISIMSDSLGLTTHATTARSYLAAARLVELGAVPAAVEERRREYMKKPADILDYKADLIKRIEYHLDGRLATVHIPWEDIAAYSDRYNPSVLVLDEMRLVDGVDVVCAIKTYPDGKITGKLRANIPICTSIAGYFGGGGHPYAAGFKLHEDYDQLIRELLTASSRALEDHDETAQHPDA